MPVHSAPRPNLARVESLPNRPQTAPKGELPNIKPQAGNTSPPTLVAKDKDMRQRLLKSASMGHLPEQKKVISQNKVVPKERKEEDSSKQGGSHSGNGNTPAMPSQSRAGTNNPASKPVTEPASGQGKGQPFLNLFGKFGQVILNGLEIINKLYEQLIGMLMATMSRAARSADQANRM
ncbi:MAG: hypothetical protein ACI9ZF_002157 [Bradyrhizobium sp.]|jgi:hypothetical protein